MAFPWFFHGLAHQGASAIIPSAFCHGPLGVLAMAVSSALTATGDEDQAVTADAAHRARAAWVRRVATMDFLGDFLGDLWVILR